MIANVYGVNMDMGMCLTRFKGHYLYFVNWI